MSISSYEYIIGFGMNADLMVVGGGGEMVSMTIL